MELNNIPRAFGAGSPGDAWRVQASRDVRRRSRPLSDGAAAAAAFTPFLVPPAPGENSDFFLAPTRPDAAPVSGLLRSLLD